MSEGWEGLVIVGLGNPILSDDGVGRRAAAALGGRFPGARVETIPMIGMDLLDRIAGHEVLVIVDAAATGRAPIGSLSRLQEPDKSLHIASSHGPDLHQILSLGRSLGLHIPQTILIYGIEIGTEIPYGESLSSNLQARLESAVQDIAADIEKSLGRR